MTRPRPHPSLNALRAFETTARLKSFTAAADELCVTHGAVSRHVKALEEKLGLQLLRRSAHAVDATVQGARLAEGLSSAFGLIQASLDQLQPGPLTLSCSDSIMMYWLIPRIARFHRAHPLIDLRFNMSHGPLDFARDNIGVALRLSAIDAPKDALITTVVDEWVGPVCSAEYLQSVRLQSHADLTRARLLVSGTRPDAWAAWLAASAQQLPKQAKLPKLTTLTIADSFEHFYLLIQAAKCGLGLANVPRMLVRDDLAAGTLVAPFGFVPGPNKLVLWVAPRHGARSETQALEEWLTHELRQSEMESPAGSKGSKGLKGLKGLKGSKEGEEGEEGEEAPFTG